MGKHSVNQIYEILEDDIIQLKILPGQAVSENELCERFDVSRTPIRSVLQRLEHNGLVQIESRKNTIVTYLNFQEITQMIYQRVAVETRVIRDFIKTASAYQIEQLKYLLEFNKKILAEYQEKQTDELFHKFIDCDAKTHKFWFHAVDKPLLWEHIAHGNSSYTRFRMLDTKLQTSFVAVLEEHSKIIDAIVENDIGKLEEAVHEHLNRSISRLGQKIFTDYKDYFKIIE